MRGFREPVLAGLTRTGGLSTACRVIASGAAMAFLHACAITAEPGHTVERFEVSPTTGVALDVWIQGHGQTVVLLPSLGRGAADFDDLAHRLEVMNLRVVRPQPRGIEDSRGPLGALSMDDLANDIVTVVEQTCGAPVIIVGHAFGNRVARRIAVQRPDLVKGLVLLAAGGQTPIPQEIVQAIIDSMTLDLPEAQRIDALQLAFFAPGNDPSVWLEGWFPIVATAQSAASRASDSSLWLAPTAPILILQPAQDTVAPPENAYLIARARGCDEEGRGEARARSGIPACGVLVVSIPGAGHAALPEAPVMIAEEIAGFARALQSQAQSLEDPYTE